MLLVGRVRPLMKINGQGWERMQRGETSRKSKPAEGSRPLGDFASYPVAVGERVADKYVIEDVIGASSMSVVFAAKHLQLGQRVAIKFLFARGDWTKDGVARFQVEAQTMARIRSPHVVRILDVGTHNNIPYIVMEHLEGEDLARVSKASGPLAVAQAALYALQAAEGIAAVHGAGIVHRDVKPSNLFLADEGGGTWVLKVIDFGIAKYNGVDTSPGRHAPGSLTDTSALIGSPRYMSPEQMTDARHVDGRADIWSLGVILQELVTGKPLIEADSISEVLVKVLTMPIPALEGVPPAFAAAVARALTRDREARTPSIAAFAEEIAPFAATDQSERLARISRVTGPEGSPLRGARHTPPRPSHAPHSLVADKTEAMPNSATQAMARERVLEGGDAHAATIELDVEPGRSMTVGAQNVVASAAPISRSAPVARSLDHVDVRVLARFGASPEHWYETPGYVRRVRARRRELAEELRTAEQHHHAARVAYEDLLVATARRAAVEIASMARPPRASYLKGIERIAKREAELTAMDAAALAAASRQRSTVRAIQERVDDARRRAEAARASSGAQVNELEAQLGALEVELGVVQSAVDGPAPQRDPAIDDVRSTFRATCIDFAVFVLQDAATFGEEYAESRERAGLLEHAAGRAEQKVTMYRAALEAYDRDAVDLGKRVTAVALALLALCVLGLALVMR
jgi:eukaryotic-like serine/threonine-protein kinase